MRNTQRRREALTCHACGKTGATVKMLDVFWHPGCADEYEAYLDRTAGTPPNNPFHLE